MKQCISKTRAWLLILLLSLSSSIMASFPNSDSPDSFGWYVGLEGGPSFGVSSLSSFGADATRCGYTIGLLGGYQITPVLSVEFAAKWGRLPMSARQCCVDADDWLSVSGHQYVAEVLGEKGEYIGKLKGNVSWQNYSLRLPVNVFGVIPALKNSPWKLELTPQLSLWCSKDKVEDLETGTTFQKFKSNALCLGYGGSVQASHQFKSGLFLGVFSGLTFLNDSSLDGLVKKQHKNNFVWESGLRLGWRFHKQ